MLKRVVFLDRDGVINRDSPDYIKTVSEFVFLPRSMAALRNLHASGFTGIVITNQSAINRQMTPRSEVARIHTHLMQAVRNGGGRIEDIFFCPHRPDENCTCRKPKPGLIVQAQAKYRIDLSDAAMIGDSAKDIECARNAGCRRAVLVRTGNGLRDESVLAQKGIAADHVAADLFEAVNWLIGLSDGARP